MVKLNNFELQNISGGGFKIGMIFGIGALITFFLGLIDGFARPLPCRK